MKIAIVKLSALGDIVHAMVVLQFIKKFNQEIEVDWIVEERYRELLESNPNINKVHVVSIKQFKEKKILYLLFKELVRVRHFGPYDMVIDMQSLIKSAIISRLIPSRLTLGFERFSAREGLASFFYNKRFKYGYDKNVIERNIGLISFACGFHVSKQEIRNKSPFLFSSNKFVNSNLSTVKKNILLIPGASHKSKCYPVSKLAELTTLIDGNFLTIWGDQKEQIMAEELKVQAPCVTVWDKISIDSLKLLISNVDLVIGPDTGPTHIAWALNIPSITLFGPTPGYRNTYYTSINRCIESKSQVNPYKIDKNDDSIKDIDLIDIVKVSKELLDK
jgi:heptosyltransferase I